MGVVGGQGGGVDSYLFQNEYQSLEWDPQIPGSAAPQEVVTSKRRFHNHKTGRTPCWGGALLQRDAVLPFWTTVKWPTVFFGHPQRTRPTGHGGSELALSVVSLGGGGP